GASGIISSGGRWSCGCRWRASGSLFDARYLPGKRSAPEKRHMADVLLAHSNHLFSDPKQVQKMQPYPPLQTLLAASVLREAGLKVAFCDVAFDIPEEHFETLLRSYAPRLVVVCEDDFNFLSKMCLSRNRDVAFWMAQAARRHGFTI